MTWFWFLCDLVLNWWWSLILCGCLCFGHARFGFGGLEWFCGWWCGALFGVFACGWFCLHGAWFDLICGFGVFGFVGWG